MKACRNWRPGTDLHRFRRDFGVGLRGFRRDLDRPRVHEMPSSRASLFHPQLSTIAGLCPSMYLFGDLEEALQQMEK